jgi:hypothetical protein
MRLSTSYLSSLSTSVPIRWYPTALERPELAKYLHVRIYYIYYLEWSNAADGQRTADG